MPARPGILIPRAPSGFQHDLVGRTPFTTHQQVRHRPRKTRIRQAATLARNCALGLGLGSLVLGLVTTGRLVYSAPYFAVRAVDVVGLERLSAGEVREAAGIAPGASIFSINPDSVQAKLEALPQVRRAQVWRELPNRVTLMVEERKPFALALAGGLAWVDEEGAVLEDQPQPVAQALPLLSGLSAEELAPERRAPSDRLRTAVTLLRTLLRIGGRLPSEISEINVTHPDDPLLYTINGVEIQLGSEAWEERLGRLEGLLGQLQNQREPVASVDLRFQNLVVLRPKGGK